MKDSLGGNQVEWFVQKDGNGGVIQRIFEECVFLRLIKLDSLRVGCAFYDSHIRLNEKNLYKEKWMGCRFVFMLVFRVILIELLQSTCVPKAWSSE